ncbi:hypothetical protein KC368_g17 [Hortaea werneckii]|nr:hypothetical protein KC368_g17 [Hortaea werneckii]
MRSRRSPEVGARSDQRSDRLSSTGCNAYLKYWIAETPVIWQLTWMAIVKMLRRIFGHPRNRIRSYSART